MAATSSVFLNVNDLGKSIEFYKGLGFRVNHETKDEETGQVAYADLSYQGADLGLGHIANNDDPEYRNWVSTPLGAGVLIYFTVPNVDKIFAAAEAQRATIEQPMFERSYGRGFTVNDPDGYVVSFLTEARKPRKAAKTKKKAAAVKGSAAKRTGGRKRKSR